MKRKVVYGTLLFMLILSLLPGCVFISAPQIATFQSTPETITAGEAANLIWATTGAEDVSITPGLGTVPLAGSRQVSPNETTTYILTARNTAGTVSSSLTVTVKPKVDILSFQAEPPKISAGDSSTLQWQTVGTSSVNISPDIGTVGPSGSYVVSPSSTQTYTITAVSGSMIITKSVTVEVSSPPVVAQFTAAPTSIELGGSSTLTWNVSGATEVTIEPELGTVPSAGSSFVFPNKTTVYVLTASSECCVVNRSVTVQVSQYPVPAYLPVVVLFNISPDSIFAGNSATLEWVVLNADSVVIDQGIGPVSPSGSIVVSPASSTTYTLTAINIYGYRQVSISIVVFVV